jgi:RimJ/RimL family protein N-acetyltransferase
MPFSTDGRVDIHELQKEFCNANKNLYVSSHLPNYEDEFDYIKKSEEKLLKWEEFENFIVEKWTYKLIGCAWLRLLESNELNIGIWIREDMQWNGYATEAYSALINWARVSTTYTYLIHSLNPENLGSQRLAEKFGWILQEKKNEREHKIYYIPLVS